MVVILLEVLLLLLVERLDGGTGAELPLALLPFLFGSGFLRFFPGIVFNNLLPLSKTKRVSEGMKTNQLMRAVEL